MGARFDHLVVSVPDLDVAMRRWGAMGLPSSLGGRHPGGTVNAVIRGPKSAYVELISTAADADPTSPWVERARGTTGPLGFALAVDDIETARDALVDAGFAPAEVAEGSRVTPEGATLRWRMCQVGAQAFDPELPFLIEWIDPMPPGPAEGPIVDGLSIELPDNARLARMLRTVGLPEQPQNTPWLSFSDGEVTITLSATAEQIGAWERASAGSSMYLRTVGAEDEADPEPAHIGVTSVSFDVVGDIDSEMRWEDIDGLYVTASPDVRSHPGHVLLPAVEEAFAQRPEELSTWSVPHPERDPLEEEYSRCLDPGKYRILAARVRAWAVALADQGVADTSETASGLLITPRAAGAEPAWVEFTAVDDISDTGVEIRSADLIVTRLPDCGCDACDDGSEPLLQELDGTFLHLIDGGTLQVADGRGRVVQTTLGGGWKASGRFRGGEPEQWLADARAGRKHPGREVFWSAPWM